MLLLTCFGSLLVDIIAYSAPSQDSLLKLSATGKEFSKGDVNRVFSDLKAMSWDKSKQSLKKGKGVHMQMEIQYR